MAERKSLMEGLKTTTSVDPTIEEKFVYGDRAKPKLATPAATPEIREAKVQAGNSISRAPLTTRIGTDYFRSLKRASLEQQLKKKDAPEDEGARGPAKKYAQGI